MMSIPSVLVAIYILYVVECADTYEVGSSSQSLAPENDPEQLLSNSVRFKRDVDFASNKIKPNSTVTHISNTTMVQMLNRLSKKSNSSQPLKLSSESTGPRERESLSDAESVVKVHVSHASFGSLKPQDASMGDLDNLVKREADDLMSAANYDSKKYILVKKKPKVKKIKMEVFEPEMKYKKIKMKIPVKKMKKKKVKGYLVKKEKYHHY